MQGLHHLLWTGQSSVDSGTLHNDAAAGEYVMLYLSVDVVLAAALVLLPVLAANPPAARPGRYACVANALEGGQCCAAGGE